jgi:chromosome segregation protein
MPYIKRMEINGFKTFGLKTTLTFERGFTVITGPNGSGKTNIIDAVLFCLGELSAKRLRSENFSNLIFNGGSSSSVRKNEAKVVIQFDNSDGRIPVETSTVTISREIDRNGESIYRINGRKVPRNHLLEVLSVAGISSYGHNIVLQGTLTRMAEISPQERRKIIEDMLGIAQYDAEKAEAESKLKEADVAIKTALGQISEVQKRLEDLERERNNLLRYNFLRREIGYLESVKTSWEIKRLRTEAEKISREIMALEEKNKIILESRENLRLKRREMEAELRKIGFDEVEKKQANILEIQTSISNLKSKLNEIASKISSGRNNLERLKKIRETLQQRYNSVLKEIGETEEKIKQLEIERSRLDGEIKEKQTLHDSILRELSEVRSAFGDKAKRIDELENDLSKIGKEKVSIESEHAKAQTRMNIFTQRLEDLKTKRDELKNSYERLQESLSKLQEIMNAQIGRLNALKETLEKRVKRKNLMEKEIKEAEKVAEYAKEALIEFEAQRRVANKIKSEESALKSIEDLAAMGVITGVHGRLKNLIKVEKGYERAIEAAASGWLDSLIVEDMNVAFTCLETLKRVKLGRVKIIPLNGLSPNSNIKVPEIDGVIGKASSFINCEKRYEQAVNFVFGDTLLVLSDDAALRVSKDGFRAVTLSGDLYEAGGGFEGGYYRAPVDFSSFMPNDETLKSLERAVKALKEHLESREKIIAEMENDIAETQGEIAKISESMGKFEGEIERIKKSVIQAESSIKQVENNISDLLSRIEKEKTQIALFESRLQELSEIEKLKREEVECLKGDVNLLRIHDAEARRESTSSEIILLRQKYNRLESEISTLRSKMENVLKINLNDLAAQLEDATEQISALEKDIEDALKEDWETRKRIEELEKTKAEISKSILSDKKEAEKFTSQIDALDNELLKLEKTYEEGVKMLNDLKLKIQTINLQLDQHMERLRTLGYEAPLDIAQGTLEDLDSQIESIRMEINSIGAVNQLADIQYVEQASRYKELSVRLNELEREKMAIIRFIEEIEQKKYRVFMDAFNKINERINSYFSRLTGGGNASLKIENPENPFAGGVDMIVQFPNKPPILVSGASSGERSVSAVAFLFALQEFSPASFYLFDEIDAHLDAFHVERLGELLAEEASRSRLQFIVITLKPEMISKANRIYGVYGRNGVSYVVSTTFKGVA